MAHDGGEGWSASKVVPGLQVERVTVAQSEVTELEIDASVRLCFRLLGVVQAGNTEFRFSGSSRKSCLFDLMRHS